MATSRASRPVVALRADVGRQAGLGHLRRCLALAHAAGEWAACHLVMDGGTAGPVPGDVPMHEVTGTVRGVGEACRALGADALVVDSYRLDLHDLRAAWPEGRPLIVVDDFGRWPVPGDLVVNSAAGLSPPGTDGERYLLGPRYALLAPEFAATVPRLARKVVTRVLLALGGATPASLMALLAHAVRAAAPGADLDVVVGPVGDSAAAVRGALTDLDRVTVHEGCASLLPLMTEADLAVTAGGVTLLELAASGTPTVGVCLAPNQLANLLGLGAEHAVVFAGCHDDTRLASALTAALAPLVKSPEARAGLSRRARVAVDGRGAWRVAERIRAELAAVRAGAADREAGR